MKYSPVTPDMTIGDLILSKHYGQFASYFFTDMTPDHFYAPLSSYGFETVGFMEGLHRIEELVASGKNYFYPVYDEETRLANWDKEKVVLAHFPCEMGSDQPYILIIPGGGLNRQWGFIEGLAIASRCNAMGYTAFVLFYRTKQEPVYDKAIEDMYAAIRFIDAHAADFGVKAGYYRIGGFSAGAMITEQIGSTLLGYKTVGIPRPQSIFLVYTACEFASMYEKYETADEPMKQAMSVILKKIGGPHFTAESIAPYNLTDHIDADYPPVFLMVNEDDNIAGASSTHLLDQVFTEKGIYHKTRIGQKGGHSFGLGNRLEVEGWLEEALTI